MRRIAVIPARGGSKRIPRKNLREFHGRPMLSYAIEAAAASGVFDHVLVSTEDDEIASCALRYGAAVPFRRPPELADDHSTTTAVMADAVAACARMGWHAGQFCCIYPAVPLLSADILVEALRLLEADDCAYVFPVIRFASPIQRALRRLPDGATRPFHPEFVSTRTQDLEPAFHDAGQFYWGRSAAWLAGLSPHEHGRTLVIPADRSVDIDTPADWARAEALYATRREAEKPTTKGPSA